MLIVRYFSSELRAKIQKTLESNSLLAEKLKIIWKISENCLSLHRQNVCFDYAAECGEQDLIDTTPFKSHLRVAFYLCKETRAVISWAASRNLTIDEP